MYTFFHSRQSAQRNWSRKRKCNWPHDKQDFLYEVEFEVIHEFTYYLDFSKWFLLLCFHGIIGYLLFISVTLSCLLTASLRSLLPLQKQQKHYAICITKYRICLGYFSCLSYFILKGMQLWSCRCLFSLNFHLESLILPSSMNYVDVWLLTGTKLLKYACVFNVTWKCHVRNPSSSLDGNKVDLQLDARFFNSLYLLIAVT